MTERDGQPLDILARFGMSDLRMSRRAVLKRAVALGLSAPVIAALLAACGGDDDTTPTSSSAATATTGGGATATTGGSTGAATATTGGSTGAATATTGSGAAATATTAPAGVTPTSGGSTTTGGTLVIGRNIDDLITLDPSYLYEISTAPITWPVYMAMVLPESADLNTFNPILCEETPSTENGGISADGLTYTFKLKKGLKFHTGGEMTAADWVFAMKRLHYRKGNPSFLVDPLVDADGNVMAEAVDDYTLKLTLNAPNVAFMAFMAGQLGQVFDSKAAAAQGALDTPAAETDDKAQTWFDQNSAGVGPYKLTAFKPKDEVVMERFADYFGDPVAYDKYVLKYVQDSGQQLEQLQGGAIDFAMELDADAIKSLDTSKFDVVQGPLLNHVYIAMMTQPPLGDILADVRVRQAIAYAIDYDAFVNDLRGGAALRPASAVPIGMLGADKVADLAYVQNVEKAKQLLADAGVAEGTEITLTFGASSSYEGVPNETSCAKLQSDIEAIGLKVTLNPMDAASRLTDFRAAKLQFTISEWGPDYLDVHAYAFPFGGVPDQAPSKRILYVNQDNVTLLDQAIKELDKTKREDLYVQIQKNMIADAAFVVLWQPISQYGIKKGLQGVEVHPGWLTFPDRIKPPAA